jgi:glycosyltransferase involved in cell wall biosynthesis
LKSKICLIIPTISSGGIETYVLRYLNFIESTEQITIIVRSNQKGELYEDYKQTGVNLVFTPLGYVNPKKAFQYYRFFKKMQFDTVCDFNANFAGCSLFLAKLAGVVKRIAFYRQGSNHFKPSLIKNLINKGHNKLVYRYATHILANSQAAIEFFFPYRKENDHRFQVIYNGVDMNKYIFEESKQQIRKDLDIPQNAYVIGNVGRLDSTKNHDTILQVAKQLIEKDSSYFLVLCGRETEKLQSEVDNLNIKSNALILGYRNDVPRVLKALDCFYFPSLTEGQPNALIEAMLSDLPFIASKISAIKECVPQEAENYLIEPTNIEEAVTLIEEIKQNPTKPNYKNHASKAFDHDKQFNKFENILNQNA